ATCPTPPPVENAEIVEDTTKKYLNGEKINYQCNDGFDIYGSAAVTCTRNKWSRLPRCVDVRCSSPSEIPNGQITSVIKAKYLPQEKVYYRCNTGYYLLGTPFITCSKNHWTETPRCAAACTANEEDMREHNIKLRWGNRNKIYSEDGNRVEFICLRGYKPHPNAGSLTAYCANGKFDYPDCI
ncbi:Complement factor H, partial [Ophiophagus hannah]